MHAHHRPVIGRPLDPRGRSGDPHPYPRRSRRSGEVLRGDRQDAPRRPHAWPRLVRAHHRSAADGPDQLRRMERRQAMRRFRFAIFGCLALVAAAAPALAVEPTPGSKNFQPPNSVPNYFSNEAGPFRGGAGAETTYSSSGPMVVSPYAPARVAAAPSRSARHQVARGKSRTRLAQARARSHRHAAQTRTAWAKNGAARSGEVTGLKHRTFVRADVS